MRLKLKAFIALNKDNSSVRQKMTTDNKSSVFTKEILTFSESKM
jgi:hypothetical protein